ncbi:unnamed protein product [Arctogadus glacialis]
MEGEFPALQLSVLFCAPQQDQSSAQVTLPPSVEREAQQVIFRNELRGKYFSVTVQRRGDLKSSESSYLIARLMCLTVLDPDGGGIVRWMDVFQHGPKICLEFELLDKSLRYLTQQKELHILPLNQIKIILEQGIQH